MEDSANIELNEAQGILQQLAAAFPLVNTVTLPSVHERYWPVPERDARYQTLIEQIPAVVFMAFLDKGMGEAYVSPQIEAILGYTQEEWLDDPVRWYQQIHPDDKDRWSVEAAELFLLGNPLKSLYRVISRDGLPGTQIRAIFTARQDRTRMRCRTRQSSKRIVLIILKVSI